MGSKVDFLACMDDAAGEASKRAETCSDNQKLPFSTIQECANGSKGTQLLRTAQEYFSQQRKRVDGFPTIFVNGKEPWSRDYPTILAAICETGITAAACSSPSSTSTPAPSPTPSPSPTPAPTPPGPTPQKTHYGKPPCQSDEQVVQFSGGSVCASSCPISGDDCPTDTPGGKRGLWGKPVCGDGNYSKYCVIACLGDDDCDAASGASCRTEGASNDIGICAYNVDVFSVV